MAYPRDNQALESILGDLNKIALCLLSSEAGQCQVPSTGSPRAKLTCAKCSDPAWLSVAPGHH